jgi:hypothetical protein
VIDGAVCPSPLVVWGVQWSALVLSEEFPASKKLNYFVTYIHSHTYRNKN